MIRTQIYLTKNERQALQLIAERMKKSQSYLIRAALDIFIEQMIKDNQEENKAKTAGNYRKA